MHYLRRPNSGGIRDDDNVRNQGLSLRQGCRRHIDDTDGASPEQVNCRWLDREEGGVDRKGVDPVRDRGIPHRRRRHDVDRPPSTSNGHQIHLEHRLHRLDDDKPLPLRWVEDVPVLRNGRQLQSGDSCREPGKCRSVLGYNDPENEAVSELR